jgi:rhamnosyltransferase
MNTRSEISVAAIVVTFRPEPDRLIRAIEALLSQVNRVYVVDNGNGSGVPERATTLGALVLRLGENRGIGAAQNAGAALAMADGATDLLLMDQDSLPAPDMLRNLLAARDRAECRGVTVAAVGAATFGPHGADGFVRVGAGRFVSVKTAPTDDPIECDQLIASGCLVSASTWTAVGPMDESLFIDKVDTDWCLRARHLGMRLIGAPAAALEHRLGGRRVQLWFGRWREFPVHEPLRYYYMMRNSVRVQRRRHAPWQWVLAESQHNLKLFIAVGLLGVAGHRARRSLTSGLLDGLRGVALGAERWHA